MKSFRNYRMITFALVFAIPALGQPLAQSQNPEWLDELALDLAVDHECEVVEYLEMQEGKIGARNTFFAKVRCRDGREFDASKVEPAEEFSIRLCEVVTC